MKSIKILNMLFILFASAVMVQCNEELSIENKDLNLIPQIISFQPTNASIGDTIVVSGNDFQSVNQVLIGNTEAKIKYKVNSKKVIIEITDNIKSGKIKVFNSKNEGSESSESFTMNFKEPAIGSFPDKGFINQSIVVEGSNLNYITGVKVGDVEAAILEKSDKLLVFSVPYILDDYKTLSFVYTTNSGNSNIIGTENGFSILKPMPDFKSIPAKAMIGTDIVLVGDNLNVVDSFYVGSQKAQVVTSDQVSLTLTIPNNVDLEGFNKIIGYYYGGRPLESPTSIRVITKLEKILVDYESWSGAPFTKSKDILPVFVNELNGNQNIPAAEGNFYGHLKIEYDQTLLNNGGSTFAELNYKGDNNWINIDEFQDPWVHIWINTNNTEPYFVFYCDLYQPSDGVASNRGTHYVGRFNSSAYGENWQLFAWRLKDLKFKSSSSATPYTAEQFSIYNLKTFRIQFRTSSSIAQEIFECNMDLLMVVDGKMKGAVDVTNHNQ